VRFERSSSSDARGVDTELSDRHSEQEKGPRVLRGPSAYELTVIGIVPMLLGFVVGLLSIPMRFDLVAQDVSFVWKLFFVGVTCIVVGFVFLGLRTLKARKEIAAGYGTLEGHPELPRLDRHTGLFSDRLVSPSRRGPRSPSVAKRLVAAGASAERCEGRVTSASTSATYCQGEPCVSIEL